MNKFNGYRCSICGTEYLPGQVTYTCPKDGGNLDVVLNYLGKSSEKIFDILVSADKIDTNLGGMAVSESQKRNEPVLQGIYVLTFLVVLLIIINIIISIIGNPDNDGCCSSTYS